VDSTRGQLTSKLVQLYGQIDPGGCAVVRQGGADGLNVNCPLVHQDICAASKNVAATYARRRQMTEAASIRRIAVEELGCAAGLVE
jgi:hypothetical protein